MRRSEYSAAVCAQQPDDGAPRIVDRNRILADAIRKRGTIDKLENQRFQRAGFLQPWMAAICW